MKKNLVGTGIILMTFFISFYLFAQEGGVGGQKETVVKTTKWYSPDELTKLLPPLPPPPPPPQGEWKKTAVYLPIEKERTYYVDGKEVAKRILDVDDKKEGQEKTFYENSDIIVSLDTYKNGEIINSKAYDNSGKLLVENLPEIIKRVQGSTVLITGYNEKGESVGFGSGFFITKNGDVITCRHVLEGAIKGEVGTINGKKYAIKEIVAEDEKNDLIRFSVDLQKDTVQPLSLSSSTPLVGERIVVFGNPLGLEATVSDGIVSAVRMGPGSGKTLQITAPISPGSSGGPVVNMKGEVVGIFSFYYTGGQNLNFAIPSERIANLLPSKGKDLAQWATSQNQERGLTGPPSPPPLSPPSPPEDTLEKSAEEFYNKGLNLVTKGDYGNALPFLEKAVEINPDFANAHLFLGLAYEGLGLYHLALDAYKQVIRINPDDASAHYFLGGAYDFLKRYQEASEAYKEAIRLNPDDASAHYSLGDAYLMLGRDQEAIDAFKQAIRLKPDNAIAYNSMGICYSNLGRYTEAIAAYKEAIRLDPDNRRRVFSCAHNNLGLAYLNLGDKGSALEEYKILKELNSGLANELFNRIYK